jgi:hypothetical protein
MRIPLGKRDNVATFSMASGFDKFRAFCCEAELDETTRNVIAMPTGFVSDDEDDDELEASDEAHRNKAWRSQSDSGPKPMLHDLDGPSSTPSKGETPKASTKKQPPTKEQPKTTDMDLPRTTNVNIIQDEEDRQPANDLAELLAIHHQFGHISMRKLQEMAKQGILPRRLSKCRVPTCSACLYARAGKASPKRTATTDSNRQNLDRWCPSTNSSPRRLD